MFASTFEQAERLARRHADRTGRTHAVYNVAGIFPHSTDGTAIPEFYEGDRDDCDATFPAADEMIVTEVRPRDLDAMLADCPADLGLVRLLVAVLS